MTSMPLRIVVGGLLLSVPVVLATLAIPRLSQGLGVVGFRAVIDQGLLGAKLPAIQYRAAADALADASPEDGESLTERAQVLALSGTDNPATLAAAHSLVVDALRDAPSNPSGWLLLCQIEAQQKSAGAVGCLDNAFAIGAYDWYTAGRRMSLVASEWPYLTEPVRDKAVTYIMPMWNTTGWSSGLTLRQDLYALSFTQNGRQLLRAGFAGHRDDLRDFNRYIIEENASAQ